MRKALMTGAALMFAATATATAAPPRDTMLLSSLAKLGTVDERFQSYNIEMVEVTGGRFWAPYGGPAGEMYRMRPPADLADPRLRHLARHLGPVYLRVSGTWANTTYLPAEGESLSTPPEGYKQILTRDQWRGVVAYAKDVGAKIVTSFAAGDGTRGPDGVWKPDQAQRLIDLTRSAGGTIYGAEFFNEPNIPMHGGLPKGYGTADFIRDFGIFRDWAKRAAPDMKIIGYGGVSEGSMMKASPQTASRGFLSTEDFMKANPGALDIVAYHFYGGVSQRCGGAGEVKKDAALTPGWLDRTLLDQAHYGNLRDRYEPGKPLWLNETAQAACGGSPWAASFLDSFRYLNQLGLLAQKGVQSVQHNTLAASDYGLIDGDTLAPRPNYWAALLWAKNMGATVLASPASPSPDMRMYAHCLKGGKGGVGLVALNTGSAPQNLSFGKTGKVWVMHAASVDSMTISINGKSPAIDAKGRLSGLDGVTAKGSISLPGQTIGFVALAGANNAACR